MYLGIRVKIQNKKLDHYNGFQLSTIVGRGLVVGLLFSKRNQAWNALREAFTELAIQLNLLCTDGIIIMVADFVKSTST